MEDRDKITKEISLRDDYIIQLREKGYSLQYIGNKIGLTRERIRQILVKYPGVRRKFSTEKRVVRKWKHEGKPDLKDYAVLIASGDYVTIKKVKLCLARNGFKVMIAYNGKEAVRLIRENRPDLVVIDAVLTEISGLEVIRILQAEFEGLAIMLTTKPAGMEGLIDVQAGADYYVSRPSNPGDFALIIRAVLKVLNQGNSAYNTSTIQHEDITVNFKKLEVYLGGKRINLTPIEFKILSMLITEPGKVFTKAQIVQIIKGYGFEENCITLDDHIQNLRGKLEPNSDQPKYIKTFYGGGYKFIDDL